jgi:hypothetical protein
LAYDWQATSFFFRICLMSLSASLALGYGLASGGGCALSETNLRSIWLSFFLLELVEGVGCVAGLDTFQLGVQILLQLLSFPHLIIIAQRSIAFHPLPSPIIPMGGIGLHVIY